MAFFDAAKKLFAREEGEPDNSNDTIINEDRPPAGDKSASRSQAAGERPVRFRMIVLFSIAIVSAFFFLLVVFWSLRISEQNVDMRAVSTEMQMLSQRLARGVSLAAQGNPEGFPLTREAYVRFENDLARLEAKSGILNDGAQDTLKRLRALWNGTFARGEAGKLSLETVLDQQDNMVSLNSLIGQANAKATTLAQLTQNLARASAPRLQEKDQARLIQMQLFLAQVSISANIFLTGNPGDPEALAPLAASLERFIGMRQSLLRNDFSGDAELTRLLSAIAENTKEYEDIRNILQNSGENITNARLACQLVLRDSENLLQLIAELSMAYEESSTTWAALIGIVLAAVTLVSLYLLALVFKRDETRRREASEAENRKNQEAIEHLLNDMELIADGDLTVRAVVSHDLTGSIADAINYTIEELRTLITEINRATEHVTRSVAQAQYISNELLMATDQQSKEIVETNQTVNRIVQSIRSVSGSAAESSKVASASLSAAKRGIKAVNDQIQGMNEIREQIQDTAKRIKRLGESSQEIGEIVELISDITEQTNVLALNAAIQAAAGDGAGRGFSILAEEVQRLAEHSAEAARQIGTIVKTIQTDTYDAVAAMELTTQGVVEGTKLSDAAGAALFEIGRVSEEMARYVGLIAAETEEQTKLATQVNASMHSIFGATDKTSRGTRLSAETVGQLSGLAAELKSSVSGFKL
ncbi:MAG: methyl-accepting chemotaxis protein [Candidatus Accumulibacter sp.]|jgi:twitching motility protein PilJ|nr:methyl-accepting chemotaxis protein [Accumulibacter sp.]